MIPQTVEWFKRNANKSGQEDVYEDLAVRQEFRCERKIDNPHIRLRARNHRKMA
jgi:hypothetical protein